MNTPKVVAFEKKLTTRQQEIQDDIIRILKDELARARRGDYVAIAVAAVGQDGAACTVSSECEQGPALMGSIYHLLARVHSDLREASITPSPLPETDEED